VIGYLQGRPLRASNDSLVLLVQGVGYELNCSVSTLQDLDGKAFVELWVYTHVREDALQLFGFSTEFEKALFLSLLKVNGVGPKSALNMLSGAPSLQIAGWIEDANVAALTKLPKVGKKSAEQIVLTLQGKLVRSTDTLGSTRFKDRSQIVSALVNLGFRIAEVEKVVDAMPPETDLEHGLRRGLSALTS
jgi:Holliday junction DNA helicase RuvA